MDISQRYLTLLKSIILNEVYVENDARMLYLFASMASGQKLDLDVYRNIAERLPDLVAQIKAAQQSGGIWWQATFKKEDGSVEVHDFRNQVQFAHSMVGRKRLENIESCLAAVKADGIKGDLAETGVWRGGATIFMKGCLKAWGMDDRIVWAADSFEGLPVPTLHQDAGYDLSIGKQPILAISLEEVQENFRRYDLLDDKVKFLKGWFRDTLHVAPIGPLALLRLDGDLYESTMDALNALYEKVSPGGFVLVDDFNDFEPCRRAVLEYRDKHGIDDPIETVDWSGVFWRKSAHAPESLGGRI